MDITQLSTTALLEYVKNASEVSPLEFELMVRLTGALDEVDLLTQMVQRLEATAEEERW